MTYESTNNSQVFNPLTKCTLLRQFCQANVATSEHVKSVLSAEGFGFAKSCVLSSDNTQDFWSEQEFVLGVLLYQSCCR